jgi:cytochrome b
MPRARCIARTDGSNLDPLVWMPFRRRSLWACMALILTAFLTAHDWENLYSVAGYSIAALLVSHFAWAFVGSRQRSYSIGINRMDGSGQSNYFQLRDAIRRPMGASVIWWIAAALVTSTTAMIVTTHSFTGLKSVEAMHEVLVHFAAGIVIVHVVGGAIATLCSRSDRQEKVS